MGGIGQCYQMNQPTNSSISKLRTIMACLRHKTYGCPWDQEQSPESIAPYTIEEAYEVVDAIQEGDTEHIKEELGDLLLQVVFYCQMAEEKDEFSFEDVAETISEKLLRRHPHVFPNNDLESFGQVSKIKEAKGVEIAWEKIKQSENKNKTNQGILSNVAKGLPPMKRAIKLQKAAQKVGFDWPNIEPALKKITEETQELNDAIKDGESLDLIEEEFGDLLFASMNVSRFLKIDPEMALVRANRKFEARFKLMEGYLSAEKKDWESYSLEELDRLWEKAKQELYQDCLTEPPK